MPLKDILTLAFSFLAAAASAATILFVGWTERRKAAVARAEKRHGDVSGACEAVIGASRKLEEAIESAYRTENTEGAETALNTLAYEAEKAAAVAPARLLPCVDGTYVRGRQACAVVLQEGERWHSSHALDALRRHETDVRGVSRGRATDATERLAVLRQRAARCDAVAGTAEYEQAAAILTELSTVGTQSSDGDCLRLTRAEAQSLLRDAASPDANTVQARRDHSLEQLADARRALLGALREHNGAG